MVPTLRGCVARRCIPLCQSQLVVVVGKSAETTRLLVVTDASCSRNGAADFNPLLV